VIIEDGDSVFQGGAQHFIHKYNRSDYSFVKSHLTKSGGDYQSGVVLNGILYASCHCNNHQYENTNTWSDPFGYTKVTPIVYIGAYDTTTFDVVPEFQPILKATGAGSEGPWDQFVDSDGCMWAGGDLNLYQNNSYFYGGFVKFCARDTTPPTVPNPSMAINGDDVTLSWAASTDNAAGSIQYEVLRDDPAFGTIVLGSTYSTNFTDADVTTATRYFVRAVDATGNRSATSSARTYSPTLGTLVAKGATWSYRSVASDPGTTWRQPGFDASSWPTGNAELGWGDGGEATVIPNATTSQYFLRHINVADPSAYAMLTVNLRRDDGAAVYVNGVEVVRSNLPAGALSYSTLASSFISGSGETTYYPFSVPASYLVTGDNVIAVELHQAGTNNGDASFDLEIVALGATESNAPSQPSVSVGTRTQSTIALSWTAATDDVAVAGYRVLRNGADVLFTNGTSFTDSGLTGATAYTYDVMAVDTSGNESTPGTVATSTYGDPNLVAYGAAWTWRFDGVDQGTAWRTPAFDDSTWATGTAELGFGDADEATVIWPGTTPTPMTGYFRRQITVTDPSAIASLSLDVIRDDGVVVYVNGVEVGRENMPAGTILYTTGASTGIATRSGETTAVNFSVPPGVLVAGTNTIAVEMHQYSAYSTDLSFNLRLVATFA
jgi:chitodextrinase